MTTVHLLLHDLDAEGAPDEELNALLNDEERERAERFTRPVHRRRYRVGRAVLRRTLASWTGVRPAAVAFEYGPNGKPAMRGGPAFNVSHSEGTLLIGVADEGRLGVDVEVLRPVDDRLALAAANFARDEFGALRSLPAAEQSAAFLRIWTRKEAFIKAVGDGLSIPLQSFCVSAADTYGNVLCFIEDEALRHGTVEQWTVRSVQMDDAPALAAAAVDSAECELAWLSPPQQ